ncbi:hypothetical protein NSU_0679 [Novosphingobium pentaromativorans US6-1]|uniref:Uncharacterized protein n=1 Tax=Novosphingobium pentaromativorans US6-1 TaxID=1088721 RepID=G6E8K9_9SPHN|nr:hypothetical protein NSU_0679 [Novosphingobium pentaromativorans US6-1]
MRSYWGKNRGPARGSPAATNCSPRRRSLAFAGPCGETKARTRERPHWQLARLAQHWQSAAP